jgi:hypothetical protein
MDSYLKIREIGKGSYGVVWLVKQKVDKKKVCFIIALFSFFHQSNRVEIQVRFETHRFAPIFRTRQTLGSARSPASQNPKASEHCRLQRVVSSGRLPEHCDVVLRRRRSLHQNQRAKRRFPSRNTNRRVVCANSHGFTSSSSFFFF